MVNHDLPQLIQLTETRGQQFCRRKSSPAILENKQRSKSFLRHSHWWSYLSKDDAEKLAYKMHDVLLQINIDEVVVSDQEGVRPRCPRIDVPPYLTLTLT